MSKAALRPIVSIGDTVLRRSTNRDENDQFPWVETVVNETYLELIYEFPEDYRKIDGCHLGLVVMSCA